MFRVSCVSCCGIAVCVCVGWILVWVYGLLTEWFFFEWVGSVGWVWLIVVLRGLGVFGF